VAIEGLGAFNKEVVADEQAQGPVEERPDGSLDVIIEAVEQGLGARAVRGRGPLVKAIGQRQERSGLRG